MSAVERTPARDLAETRVAAALLAVLVVVRFLHASQGYDLQVALRGFSPIGWIHRLAAPADFVANWPDGTDAFAASLLMQAYRLAHQWFGVDPEVVLPAMISVEVVVTALAHWIFARALLPSSRPLVHATFAALALVSNASATSLANFGAPYFWGQFYNFANALRLLAIACALTSRWALAGVFIGLCAMTHVIYGVTGAAAVFAIRVWSRERLTKSDAIAIGAALLLAGGWMLGVVARPGMGGGGVPPDVWYAWTRFFNSHFYPIDGGMLGARHTERLLPFLTLMGVGLAMAFRDRGPVAAERRGRALGAVALLVLLTVIGLVVSVSPPSPVLVKLCLHRASDLASLFVLGWVVAGALEDWDARGYVAAALAVVFLLSPFLTIYDAAYPLVMGLAWVVASRLRARWTAEDADAARLVPAPRGLVLAGVAFALAIGTAVYAGAHGARVPIDAAAYTSWAPVLAINAQVTRLPLVALLALLLVRRRDRRVAAAGLVAALAFATAWWLQFDRRGSEVATQGPAYKDVQLWARDNTPRGSLFMPDPTTYYGWRDFSRRPSFGNVREWVHTSWLYDSRVDVFEAGRARLAALGLAVEPYLDDPGGQGKLTEDARRAYYALDDAGRRRLVERFAIDYFILDRRYFTGTSTLPVAYQNDRYLVLEGRTR